MGNEVLDAMPVQLLARVAGVWHERGVTLSGGGLVWADRLTDLRPPLEVDGEHDYLTEIHAQGDAFVRTLADRLQPRCFVAGLRFSRRVSTTMYSGPAAP